MIFDVNQNVIYLTKKKMYFPGGEIELKWPNIDEAVEQVAKKFKDKNYHVILGDCLSFVFHYTSEKEVQTREMVLDKLKKMMPVEASDEVFDWSIINKTVQIIALPKDVYNVLSETFSKFGLNVLTAQPICTVLADRTELINKDVLVFFNGQEQLAILTKKGVVCDCVRMKDASSTEISRAIEFAKNAYQMEIKTVMLFTVDSKFELNLSDNLEVTKMIVDPFKLILESKLLGKDENVLSIKIHKTLMPLRKIEELGEKINEKMDHEIIIKPKKELPKLALALMILVTGALIIGAILYLRSNQKSLAEIIQPIPSPTPVPTLIPTPTPIIEKGSLKLQILNATETSGKAASIGEIVSESGYSDFVVGNKDDYDKNISEISFKEIVQQNYRQELVALLTEIEATESGTLTAESEFDVVIVVGK